jgi:hypothetical protein
MRVLIRTLVIALLLTGCTHTSLPCAEEFYSIHDEEYLEGYNDCSNMSAKYARILREAGYEADLLILYNEDASHCIVVVPIKGEVQYMDPANGVWGRHVRLSDWENMFVLMYKDINTEDHDGFKER